METLGQENTSMRVQALNRLAALTFASIATVAANAEVTFDSSSGEGFVGKGDVQEAFGWSNKQLQDNAAALNFTYSEVGFYTVVCTGHSNSNQNPRTFSDREIGVLGGVDFLSRRGGAEQSKQINGFVLSGMDEENVVSNGEGCPAAWTTEVSRTLNSNVGSTIGLYVHFEGEGVKLWPPVEGQ
jgi:hypothetical protein